MNKIKIFFIASISILTACKSSQHNANQSDEADSGTRPKVGETVKLLSSDKPPKGVARCTGSFTDGDNKYTLTLSFGLVPNRATAPWPTSSAPAVELTSSSLKSSQSEKKILSRLELFPDSNSKEENEFSTGGVPTRKHSFNIKPSDGLLGECQLFTRGFQFIGKDSQGVFNYLDSYTTKGSCKKVGLDNKLLRTIGGGLECDPFTETPESLKLKIIRVERI